MTQAELTSTFALVVLKDLDSNHRNHDPFWTLLSKYCNKTIHFNFEQRVQIPETFYLVPNRTQGETLQRNAETNDALFVKRMSPCYYRSEDEIDTVC